MDSITREYKLYGAAGGMALIIISLFLNWVSVGGGIAEVSFKGTDFSSWWLFALIPAAIALVVFVMEAREMDLPLPQLNIDVASILAIIAATWAASHFVDVDNRAIGAFLALIGAIIGAVGALMARAEG